jgi:hypothetical protein
MPPSPQQQLDRQAQRRLAVLRHAEEVTGNVSLTCRYYGISRTLRGAKTRFRVSDLRFLPLGYAAFRYSLIRPSTARRRLSRT